MEVVERLRAEVCQLRGELRDTQAAVNELRAMVQVLSKVVSRVLGLSFEPCPNDRKSIERPS